MQMQGVIDRYDFVNGGHERAVAAMRMIVKAEYAERWKQATWIERWRLWAEIEEEVERRVGQQAPPDALY